MWTVRTANFNATSGRLLTAMRAQRHVRRPTHRASQITSKSSRVCRSTFNVQRSAPPPSQRERLNQREPRPGHRQASRQPYVHVRIAVAPIGLEVASGVTVNRTQPQAWGVRLAARLGRVATRTLHQSAARPNRRKHLVLRTYSEPEPESECVPHLHATPAASAALHSSGRFGVQAWAPCGPDSDTLAKSS